MSNGQAVTTHKQGILFYTNFNVSNSDTIIVGKLWVNCELSPQNIDILGTKYFLQILNIEH